MSKRELNEQQLYKLKCIIRTYDMGKPYPSDEKIIKAWEKVRPIKMQINKKEIIDVYKEDIFNELNKLTDTQRRRAFEKLIFDHWHEGLIELEKKNVEATINKGQAKITSASDERSIEKAPITDIKYPHQIDDKITSNESKKLEELKSINEPTKLIEAKDIGKGASRKSDISDKEAKAPKPPLEPPISDSYRFTLKNGLVGQKYSDELTFDKIPIDGKIINYEIKIKDFYKDQQSYANLDKIGLQLIKDKKLISGIPTIHGKPEENYDFHLEIIYETDKGKRERRELSLKILPDPRSLWKEIEPPKDSKYKKDHTYTKLIQFQEKKPYSLSDPLSFKITKSLVAASKRGRSHAHKGSFRDDHVTIEHMNDSGWTIIAVADGAGSAEFSRRGSLIACENSVEIINSQLKELGNDLKSYLKDEKNIKNFLYHILAETTYNSVKLIETEAKKSEHQLKDFHTTLLLLICKKIDKQYFIAGFWVGDGALAIYSKDKKEIELLGYPDSGEFSGQTKFITMNEVIENGTELMSRIHYKLVDDFTALFAMTDGVSDPKFGTDNNLKDKTYWDKLWDELQRDVLSQEQIDQKLLDWLDFWSEGEHDDRTIAILF
ncbi:MAG: PP2C family serine/threonine-protein phosphatase [Candidatus Hodarchaeota archaeon]